MRKFYQDVAVIDAGDGYSITLDDRPVKTPGKALLCTPSQALAVAVAEEWRAQEDNILPNTMPLTQFVNTAIDRIAIYREAIVTELVAYGHTDLLCYQAMEPDELVAQQAEKWGALLDCLQEELDVHLNVTTGIIPIKQPDAVIQKLKALIQTYSDFELAAFHSFAVGFSSVALALLLTRGLRDFDTCWQASILEQTFQEIAWGTDAEAEDARNKVKAGLLDSLRLWKLLLR